MSSAPLVQPFRALRPVPERAADVIAPPYDVVDTEEARALATGRPASFLHISRPEIDFPPGTDPHSAEVYARGAENLGRLVADGVLVREAAPCFYAYRMSMGAHVQTGIALTASVSAYEANRIRRHELTRPAKEDDRVRNIESLNAQTGPVLLAYRSDAAIAATLAAGTAGEPLIDATGQHGVRHTVWRIDDAAAVTALAASLEGLGGLYIADGHHRSAAAARVAAARRGAGSAPAASHEYFLAVAFPDDEMKIYDYNRVVADLNGLTPGELLAAAAERFEIAPIAGDPKPSGRGRFAMYLAGSWYSLVAREATPTDPVAALDVSRLQSGFIAPVLGIGDPRTDPRIDFVGGVRGLDALAARVDAGRAAVAFALYPTGMGELMAVADAGLLMPPKSTWFEPKLADGLLSHVLD